MLLAYRSAILLSTLTALANALDTSFPLVLNFEVHRGDSQNGMSIHNKLYFDKRDDDDGSVDMKLKNEDVMYMATIKVGSNEDEVQVQVDTGSSDLYVMTPDVDCYYDSYKKSKRMDPGVPDYFKRENYYSEYCTTYGSFDYKKSTTFNITDDVELFFISYMDNTGSKGFWGSDTMQVGDAKLETAIFAVANESSTNSGVFGIGFRQLESNYYYFYDNIPIRLKSEGFINKNAYSLYLNSENQTTGSVLFGAVDHAKYSGTLTSIPVVNSTDVPSTLLSLLYGVEFFPKGEDGSTYTITNNTYLAMFDSGTTLSVMPVDLIYRFGEMLGGVYLNGYYKVPCSNSEDIYFTFDFGGANVKVPLSNLLVPSTSSSSVCYLGLMESYDDYIVLGDNILRSMYVVYDLDDLSISIAQAKYTNDTDIEVIGTDGAIPSATKAATYASNSYDYSTVYESTVTEVAVYSTGALDDSVSETYDPDEYLLTHKTTSTKTTSRRSTTKRSTSTRSTTRRSTSTRSTSTGSTSTGSNSASSSTLTEAGNRLLIQDTLSNKCYTLVFGILGTILYF